MLLQDGTGGLSSTLLGGRDLLRACSSGDAFVELLKDENLVLGRTGGDGVLLLLNLGFIRGDTGGFEVLFLSFSIIRSID